ncbi:hypothetical protein F2Q70_00005407 [Brassica cretica]|uniref:Uncharacterized protein n=1 Tax=Brassica cretica TaxID=69181 RepID=A0A8S9J259_BRACR|nr:hypothetical protein F2Q70_00005407 [Brassica cretica]
MCLRTQNPYMASHLSLLLLITLSSVVSKTFWADVAEAASYCSNADQFLWSFLSSSNILITDPLDMSLLAVEHFKSVLGPQWYSPPNIPSSPGLQLL